jgi:tetratricopeptide (TPR) repeat protein
LLALVQQAESDAISGDAGKIQPVLEALTKIDPNYAEYHYRLGQSYFATDRYADAQLAFSRALNEDVCPLRAVDEIKKAIERVARELQIPVVDFEHKLRQLCDIEYGHSILGEEYFLDHVHPTIDVNRRLALWIIEELQARTLVQGKRVINMVLADEFSAVEERVLSQIDQEAQAFALRNLAKVLHWAGKFEEAVPRARDVLAILPKDPESRFILARCLSNMGRSEEALEEYDQLFANGVDYPRAYLPFGQLLAETGNLEQAKAYLLLAVLHEPKNAAAYYALGLVHLRLKEFPFAVESFDESNRLYADDAQTLFYLAQAKAGLGEHSEAMALYEKVLSKGVRAANVHYQYGLSLLEANQHARAILEFKKAIEIAPDWIEAQEQLELVSKSMGVKRP